MIAKLKGIVDSIGTDWLILDVQGVGYHVHASSKTLSSLPGVGAATSLLIDMLIRNELPALFGFTDAHEQACFQKLITVQGVGPKVALAILSALSPDELALAIYNQDKTQVSRADGVGPKLAARLITELKDKLMTPKLGAGEHSGGTQAATSPSAITDVLSALENLGYKRSEVSFFVSKAVELHGTNADTAILLKASLALLSPKLTGVA